MRTPALLAAAALTVLGIVLPVPAAATAAGGDERTAVTTTSAASTATSTASTPSRASSATTSMLVRRVVTSPRPSRAMAALAVGDRARVRAAVAQLAPLRTLTRGGPLPLTSPRTTPP